MQGLKELLLRHGAKDCGVVPFSQVLPLLECRKKREIPPGAQSVIVCVFPYDTGDYPQRNVAKYAVVQDYHAVAQRLLGAACQELETQFPGEEFCWFADNSPIREVDAAVQAGLGVLGDQGLLIHPTFGTYVFLGEIVTTLSLPSSPVGDARCLHCGACQRACPGQALDGKGGLNKNRCRSHITQKKGELTPWEQQAVRDGGLVCGCDICQEVCPLNQKRKIQPVPLFWEDRQPVVTQENLGELLKTRAYGYRGEKVILRNLKLLSPLEGSKAQEKENG